MNYCVKGLYVIYLFTGSVFLTSGKFVNSTNTPKFYFVIVSLLVVVSIIATYRNKRRKLDSFTSKTILWSINIVCFSQACYGLCQQIGWLPSKHSSFFVTGSFDNPAGFAAVLAMSFPINLFLLLKTKNIEKYLCSIALVVVTIAIFLSGSRTGILAIVISLFAFFLSQGSMLDKFQKLRYYKIIATIVFVLIVLSSFALYHQKKDSANGRLLIWKVSLGMVKHKPVLGHGYGAFKAKYMNYQAEYLKNNPDSKYSQLAGNVKHPFNEFIKVAIEFGIVGLAIILLLTILIFRRITKSRSEVKPLILSGLSSFLVFASFSYPLQYIGVCLLLAFYLFILLPTKEIRIRNSPVSMIARIIIVATCVFSLFNVSQQIRAEIKWKAIAENSLNGKTEEMLPEYAKLYSTSLRRNPFFLYNYGAELNFVGKFDESINILTECQQRFNDYDLQMILADNYHKKGETEKAIDIYKHSSNMIPCRFLPLYKLVKLYQEKGNHALALNLAKEIINKPVKVQSVTVNSIKREMEEIIDMNKEQTKQN